MHTIVKEVSMAQNNPFDPQQPFHPDQQNNVFPEPEQKVNPNSGYVPITTNPEPEAPANSSENKLKSLAQKNLKTDSQINTPPVLPKSPDINQDYQTSEVPPQQATPIEQNAQNVEFQPKGFGVIQPEVILPEDEKPKKEEVKEEAVTFWTSPRMKKIKAFCKKRWYVVFIAASVLIGLIISGVVWLRIRSEVDTNLYTDVKSSIEAPVTSPSGSPSSWIIRVKNNETVPIENIEIDLEFDSSFKFLKPINPQPAVADGTKYSISRLDGLGNGVSETIISFEGILTGNIDEETTMKGSMSYTPSPIKDRANNRKTVLIDPVKTKIIAPEIRVEINPDSDKVENGGDLGVAVVFENLSDRELNDIQVELTYPTNGNYLFSGGSLSVQDEVVLESPSNSNNIWRIDTLPRLKEARVQIDGQVQAADGLTITFDAAVSIRNSDGDFQVLGTSSSDVQVTSQALVIDTFIEGRGNEKTFDPGDTVSFVVDYQNKGTSTVRAVEIISQVDDPANILDYSTLKFVGGDAGNQSNRSVRWRPASNPQLENLTPKARGSLRYTINVKDEEDFINQSLSQTQYTLRPSAQAQAQNVDTAFATGDLYRATGNLEFNQSISEKSDCDDQANCKIFTITWQLSNAQNVVNDIKVQTRSALPPNMWDQSSIVPGSDSSNVFYDPVNGEITWSAGTLQSYTGISNSPKSMSFDVKVVADNINQVEIFRETDIRGVDDVTGQTYEIQGPRALGRDG